MYLAKYLKERISTWFYDKKEDRFDKLATLPFYINKDYLQDKLLDTVRRNFYYTDMLNNVVKIKLQHFDNLWLKIVNENNNVQVELFTILDEPTTVLSVDKINHKLFYEIVTQNYYKRHNPIEKEVKSKWRCRQINYDAVHRFVNEIHSLDLTTFITKKTIEISLNNLKVYNKQVNLNQIPVNKILFFQALQDETLLPVLENYTLLFDQKSKDFDVHCSEIENVISHHEVCELFKNYSITRKQVEYISEFNKNNTINLILDYTEASLNLPLHENSYYYQVLENRLKQKNIYTYFMFLRLAFFGKLSMLPESLIDSLDDEMLEEFDKLTSGLLQICKDPELQYANLYTNNFKQTLEVNIYNVNYEEVKGLLYKLVEQAPNRNVTVYTNYFSNFLIELMSSAVFHVKTVSDAIEIIERFDNLYNLRKLKLKHKLDKKLVSKEIVKKEKVKKI